MSSSNHSYTNYYDESQVEHVPFRKSRYFFFLGLAIFLAVCIIGATNVEGVGTYPAVDPNMVLYYHFNNDSSVGESYTGNGTIYDYSSNRKNGTFMSQGIFNRTGGYLGDGAWNLNFTNYIRVANNLSWSPYANANVTTFSLWAWMGNDQVGAGTVGRQYIFSKGASNNFEYEMQRTNSSDGRKINFVAQRMDAGASDSITLVTGWTPETWYHFVVVYNGTAISGYVNGRFVTSATLVDPNGTGTADLNIGTRANTATGTTSGAFNGSVDEFIIYNRSLSARDIWDLYYTYAGCYTPILSDNLLGNTSWCSGKPSMNSSSGSAVLTVAGGNMDINCNGGGLKGNYSTGVGSTFRNRGIHNVGNYQNITIRNCVFDDYYLGIYSRHSFGFDVINVTAINSQNLLDFDNMTNANMYNSTAINSSLFGTENFLNNSIIYGSKCLNSGLQPFGVSNDCMTFENASNVLITNNNFTSAGRIKFQGTLNRNINFTYNYFSRVNNSLGRILAIQGSDVDQNVFIAHNTFETADVAVYLSRVQNTIIFNNTIRNITTNEDTYDSGILCEFNCTNLLIENNTLIDFGSTGILLRQTNGAIIRGNNATNTLNVLNGVYDCSNGAIYCNSEPTTCYMTEEIFKGFIPIGTQQGYGYTEAHAQVSNNITYSNNLCNGVSVVMRSQGTTNLIHDFTNTWYRILYSPQFTDQDEFWISNDWNNASKIQNHQYDIVLSQGIFNNWSYNYSLTKNYDYIQWSRKDNASQTITRGNNSNALFHNGTSLCTGSSSNIADNDGNVNITLLPSGSCYVLDNYSPTVGETRTNDPIWNGVDRATNVLGTTITFTIDGFTNKVITISDGTVYRNVNGPYTVTLDSGEYALLSETSFEANDVFGTYTFIFGGGGALVSVGLLAGIIYMFINGSLPFKTFIKVLMISIVMLMVAGVIMFL